MTWGNGAAFGAFEVALPSTPGVALFPATLVVAVTAVWAASGIAVMLLRRRSSAALRHKVWALSMASAAVLPAVLLAAPGRPVGILGVSSATSRGSDGASASVDVRAQRTTSGNA